MKRGAAALFLVETTAGVIRRATFSSFFVKQHKFIEKR